MIFVEPRRLRIMEPIQQSEEVLEVVEIEIFALEEKPLPRAKRYIIRVDKEKVTAHHSEITGAEILALVHKTPEKFKLYEHRRHHQPKLIRPDEVVRLHAHHIERFTTMPKDTTEGLGSVALSQAFSLPEADRRYLDNLGLAWECLRDGGTQWLIIHGWQTPDGYNCGQVDVALLIPPLYSDAQIDMAYFSPHLSRIDGRPIRQLTNCTIQQKSWQRWSRHRTAQNPWRPGVDDVGSHLALVDDWLRREFEQR
jgi:Prokaryotic E2 family E/Multiubiquitin